MVSWLVLVVIYWFWFYLKQGNTNPGRRHDNIRRCAPS